MSSAQRDPVPFKVYMLGVDRGPAGGRSANVYVHYDLAKRGRRQYICRSGKYTTGRIYGTQPWWVTDIADMMLIPGRNSIGLVWLIGTRPSHDR